MLSTEASDFFQPINDTPDCNYTSYNEKQADLFEVPTGLIVLLSILYGTVSVLAVIGNFLVIWIVSTSRRMQNVTNLYIANLALADVTIGMFAIPFQFHAALLQTWVLPYFMCPFCPFIQVLTINVSVFTLTAIALDRHEAVLYPLHSKPSKRRTKQTICCIWVVALSLALPMPFSWHVTFDFDTDLRVCKPFCEYTEFGVNSFKIYRTVIFIFQYFIPLCLIIWAYFRIGLVLWGSKVPGNAQSQRDLTILNNKKKVIKMLLIVVSLFALCWLPLQLYNVLSTYLPDINVFRYINVLFFCFDWLAMSNACYNPFIYGIYNEKFRREFHQRMPLCWLKIKNGTNGLININKYKKTQTNHSDRRDLFERRKSSNRSTYCTTLHTELVRNDSLKPTIKGTQEHIPLHPLNCHD